MVVRAPGDTPFPPDESGAPPFQNDVDLPWWQGGGQGFGPGGFLGNPRLTANPAGPPPGVSLSGPGGSSAAVPGDVIPPTNSTIPNNKSVGSFTGGTATENAAGMGPHIDPTTGKPEMLTGPGGIAEKTAGFNPFSLLGAIPNPYWKAAIAGAGAIAPTPAETGEFNPAMVAGRPEAPMGGVHGVPAAAPQTYPHMPWPDTGTAPAASGSRAAPLPPVRPRAAAPVAARPAAPPPSLFTQIDRPNADVAGGARGRQSVPQMSALDLSKLFARQQ